MSDATEDMEPEIYRFPDFFERLRQREALQTRDAVESETELDGLVYHHRGVQVPAGTAAFIWDPHDTDDEIFRLDTQAYGPRTIWADFDATMDWDVYLLLFEKGAAVAWMTDAEFEAEEAATYASKAAAILDGRFSFGTVFLFGPDWLEREDWALESTAPALIQRGDGKMFEPGTAAEFYEAKAAIPRELRRKDPEPAPEMLGLVDAQLSTTK